MDLQNEYESYVFIPDYHALTSVQNPKEMTGLILNLAMDYLALGLEPANVTIFKQSDVPQVTELNWIFNCITTMPYLMRSHAFKDAEAKNKEIDVGTFNYPLLMAADILIQDADLVPTGQDQKQHVEIARDTAEKFNRLFGETFKIPEGRILSEVAVVPGLDGRKMSKSYGNTIPLFAEDDEIEKLCMSIVTDSKGVGEPKDSATDNVFALHKLFSTKTEIEELELKYTEGKIGYAESKKALAEKIKNFIGKLREKRREFESDKSRVIEILKDGGEKARERAEKKMKEVREKIGVSLG